MTERHVALKSVRFVEVDFYEIKEGYWRLLDNGGQHVPGVGMPIAGGMHAKGHPEGTRICVTTRIHSRVVKKKEGAGAKFPDDPYGILPKKGSQR